MAKARWARLDSAVCRSSLPCPLVFWRVAGKVLRRSVIGEFISMVLVNCDFYGTVFSGILQLENSIGKSRLRMHVGFQDCTEVCLCLCRSDCGKCALTACFFCLGLFNAAGFGSCCLSIH